MADEDQLPETPFDASDPEAVRKRQQELADREKLALDALAEFLKKPAAQNWIWDKLTACHVFETSFTTDTHSTAFREGERNIGLMILADITKADPNALIKMMRKRRG